MRSTSIRTLAALIAFAMAIALCVVAAGCSRTGLFGTEIDDEDADAGARCSPTVGSSRRSTWLPSPTPTSPPSARMRRLTLIYAVTEEYPLLRFDPTNGGSFARIGTLGDRPLDTGVAVSPMAVDRQGIRVRAHTMTSQGTCFASASPPRSVCRRVRHPTIGASAEFGMGFSANEDDGEETLYVAGVSGELGSIDTSSYLLTDIGGFTPPVTQGELTGTGDGRLFSFYATTPEGPVSAIVQIDKTNASVIWRTSSRASPRGADGRSGSGGATTVFTAPDGASRSSRAFAQATARLHKSLLIRRSSSAPACQHAPRKKAPSNDRAKPHPWAGTARSPSPYCDLLRRRGHALHREHGAGSPEDDRLGPRCLQGGAHEPRSWDESAQNLVGLRHPGDVPDRLQHEADHRQTGSGRGGGRLLPRERRDRRSARPARPRRERRRGARHHGRRAPDQAGARHSASAMPPPSTSPGMQNRGMGERGCAATAARCLRPRRAAYLRRYERVRDVRVALLAQGSQVGRPGEHGLRRARAPTRRSGSSPRS